MRHRAPPAAAFVSSVIVIVVVAVVAAGNGGCRDCAYETGDLPVVRCAAVADGAAGCVGLPPGAPSRPRATYPRGCEVIVASPGETCGYASFVCVPGAGGARSDDWAHDG